MSDDDDIISLDSEEEEDFLIEQEGKKIETPSSYRFVMIEGIPNQAEVQKHWAGKWNLHVSSNWDIIDVVNKLFIEVKVTTLSDTIINEFRVKCMGMEENSVLAVVNPSTGKIKYFPQPLRAQGEDKVTSFIQLRCQVMRKLGISDHHIHEEENLIGTVYCNQKFMLGFNEWMDSFLKHKNLPPPPNIESNTGAGDVGNLNPFDIKQLESALVDPLDHSDLPILWKGKLLPEGWVKNQNWDDATDSQLINRYNANYLNTSKPIH